MKIVKECKYLKTHFFILYLLPSKNYCINLNMSCKYFLKIDDLQVIQGPYDG